MPLLKQYEGLFEQNEHMHPVLVLIHYQQYQVDMQAISNHIRQYGEDREKNIEDRERQEAAEMHRKHLEVLQWFSAADTTTLDQEQHTRIRREYPGSGHWILKNEKVRRWQEDDTPPSSILWLNGKQGAGNSLAKVPKSRPKRITTSQGRRFLLQS